MQQRRRRFSPSKGGQKGAESSQHSRALLKRNTQPSPTPPIVDTFSVAESRLATALTYDQKADGLKAAAVAISEMNVTRLRSMLTLMATVEQSLYQTIIDNPEDLDTLSRVYQIIHRSSVSANAQIADTLKLMSNDKLAGLFLNPAIIPQDAPQENGDIVSKDCAAVLRELSSMGVEYD